jgi:hypothetical protein
VGVSEFVKNVPLLEGKACLLTVAHEHKRLHFTTKSLSSTVSSTVNAKRYNFHLHKSRFVWQSMRLLPGAAALKYWLKVRPLNLSILVHQHCRL